MASHKWLNSGSSNEACKCISVVTIGFRRSVNDKDGGQSQLRPGRAGNLQGYVSGNSDHMLKKSPGSESVGYALNVADTPHKRKIA